MKTLHTALRLTLLLFSAFVIPSSGLLSAAPPELILLQQTYDKAVAERVTAPFEAALTALNTQYSAALDGAATEAKKEGKLPDVIAIEADKTALFTRQPPPETDDDSTPESLKKLRAIYRAQYTKLTDTRTTNHNAFLPAYVDKLKTLETTLTKADRVDEAKEIMAYREGLGTGVVATLSQNTDKPAAPGSKAAASQPPLDAGPKVSAEDASLQLVEWAVKNGHSATIVGKKGALVIKTPQDIPEEKFDLYKIEALSVEAVDPPPWRLFQFTPNVGRLFLNLWEVKVEPMDFAMLRNLKKLKSFEIGTPINDVSAWLAAMPELPSLIELVFLNVPVSKQDLAALVKKYPDLHNAAVVLTQPITDEDFGVIAGWKKLTMMRFNDLSEGLNEANAKVINKMPAVTNLTFFGLKVAPFAPATAAQFSKISIVGINYGLPEGTLASICAMPALENLTLRKIDVLDDAALAPISAVIKLKTLSLEGDSKLTDAALDHLKGLKKLKQLNLKDTGITDAGIAAFKKARPDVTVTR